MGGCQPFVPTLSCLPSILPATLFDRQSLRKLCFGNKKLCTKWKTFAYNLVYAKGGCFVKRRDFLALPAGAAVPAFAEQTRTAATSDAKLKVAAVVTEYRWYSHADVICGRLLAGYSANNAWTPSKTHLTSLHRVQTPKNDMGLDLSARHGFRLQSSIPAALAADGKPLGVDAVVFVGEHGDYPFNSSGQHLYPRYELFSQILDVYQRAGRGVPTFFDKHLSYDWHKAKTMFDRVRSMGFPFMAGSSVPLTLRQPDVQPKLETPMTEAACIGYGPLDAYGFHLLEVMQSIVERRKGGESGVAEVEMIEGDGIWTWLDGPGTWAVPLLQAAYAHDPSRTSPDYRGQAKDPVLFRVQYRDGFKAAALMLSPSGNDRTIAVRIAERPQPLSFLFGPPTDRPLPHFDGLVRCIEEMFVTGKELYPAERTLLTTGILSYLFESRRTKATVSTPELRVMYRAPENAWYQKA